MCKVVGQDGFKDFCLLLIFCAFAHGNKISDVSLSLNCEHVVIDESQLFPLPHSRRSTTCSIASSSSKGPEMHFPRVLTAEPD